MKVTERTKSEERNRAIVQGIPDLIFHISKEGVYLDIVVPEADLLAAPVEELLGRNMKDVLPEKLARRIQAAVDTTIETGKLQTLEYTLVTLDGKEHEFEARLTRINEEEAILLTRDVTEQRRLEREFTRISTREQQRLGRDLHDILGSHLTGISMMAQSLTLSLKHGGRIVPSDLEELTSLINESIEQVRALSRGLNPVSLEKIGLEAALRELTAGISRLSGRYCLFESTGDPPPFDSETNVQLYWIVQEAVTNALRHAHGATAIHIRLACEDDWFVVTVQDDGPGFSRSETTDGMGLRIMRYRARLIRAALLIDSKPGKGTLVRLTLPI